MKVNIFVVLAVALVSVNCVPDERCPPMDDPEVPPVLLPHPSNCSLFLICSHGNAVVSRCPPGLHWSDKQKRCDYPAQAQCKPQEASLVPEPSDDCPAEYDPDRMVYISHETDCSKYYICDPFGVPLVQDCPAGLHWNPLVNYCDFPVLAQCEL